MPKKYYAVKRNKVGSIDMFRCFQTESERELFLYDCYNCLAFGWQEGNEQEIKERVEA